MPTRRRGTQVNILYCCCNKCHGTSNPLEFTSQTERKTGLCGHIHVTCWGNHNNLICKLCTPE